MDKPISLSIKDFLIRKMSVKLNLSEKIIESVVNHQFQSATLAFNDNKSVELSGFGKFLFNEKKAMKKMDVMLLQQKILQANLLDETLSERKKKSTELKLESLAQAISILKPKIYETKSDLRGMEEQVDSPSRD
jgi:nucleoid DNA-binding protein